MKILMYLVAMLVLSLVPFVWHGTAGYQVLGFGDFISILNTDDYWVSVGYVFNQNLLAGADFSFLGAHLVPYLVFYWFFSLLKINPYTTTLAFLSLILFLSQVSMFLYMRYVIHEKIRYPLPHSEILSIIAAIIYGFSPYIVGLIYPGHVLLLFAYAFFPVILMTYDRLLNERTISVASSLKLFGLFFVTASSFANIGSLVALFIVLLAYSLFSYVFLSINLWTLFSRLSVTAFAATLSNAWWMIPYLFTIKNTIAAVSSSGGIPGGFGDAAIQATITNIFFGRAENLIHMLPELSKYMNKTTTLIFILYVGLFCVALMALRKHKYFLVLLAMLLFGIYLTKTNQPPFYEPYKFFYERIQILQIFRRPVSKFYWIPIFFYIITIVTGLGVALKKWKRLTPYLVIGGLVSSLYFAYLLAKTPLLTPFTIPSYYYDAQEILKTQNTQRLLMLPSTYGFQPTFNNTLNGYYGVDFLSYVWPYSIIYPDSSSYSLALPFKARAVALVDSLREEQSICKEAKELNVSHIVVRQDLAAKARTEDSPDDLIRLLDRSEDISSRYVFGANGQAGIALFALSTICRGSLVRLIGDDGAEFAFRMISPVRFEIQIKHLLANAKLQYLSNYSDLWYLFPSGNWHHIFPILLQTPTLSSKHHSVFGYSNEWAISPDIIKRFYRGTEYSTNDDGSININLTLYYIPQLVAYAGRLITGTTMFTGCLWLLIRLRKGKRK